MQDELQYASDEPDISVLQAAYETTVTDLDNYVQQQQQNYDDRRNIWPGKSFSLRKEQSDAFPWQGASDTEAHVIDERINAYISLMISALNRANIRAYPTETNDVGRAKTISSVLKWMVTNYIPNFKKEMEVGANTLLENGLIITYTGWNRESRTTKRILNLQEIPTEVAQLILDGDEDEKVIASMKQAYPDMSNKRAKRALRDLRKEGQAELVVSEISVDHPTVQCLRPEGEFFFPYYVTDPQQAPYCFWRTYMTPQALRGKVITEDWDESWVDWEIKHNTGRSFNSVFDGLSGTGSASIRESTASAATEDLIEVVYAYQRLIDEEDGSEGIYCTIMGRDFNDVNDDRSQNYAKHLLMNGFDDYPVVVTRLSEESRRMYDVTSFPQTLRGIQYCVKAERDSRFDRNSMATLPPVIHPRGSPPSDYGPGRFIPENRKGEIHFGDAPAYNPGSTEMEIQQLQLADALVGLDHANPLSSMKRQYYVDKFLQHVEKVLRSCYKNFIQFGKEEVWFRVTGVPEAQQFQKGDKDEKFDIMLGFDVLNTDPEMQEKKIQAFASLIQFDRNGRINMDALLDAMAASIDPTLADSVMQPAEVAQDEMQKNVTDDLTKIFSGIEVPARPNGAQSAMKLIGEYAQQPDIQKRMSEDEEFGKRIQKYYGQYEFQTQQEQNAQIGRVGTQPASVGNVQTQGMAQ